MLKNILLLSVVMSLLAGCNYNYDTESQGLTLTIGTYQYDSGSKNKSVRSEYPIPFTCFKNNISQIKELSINAETDTQIVLSASGITSVIEFKNENSTVVYYSIKTTTEKAKDYGIHKVVVAAINAECLK